ncbi:MAG TPA: hypothetical protein VK668_19300 [Mucilaginibacter sp.]|nr:hypothetical protein [Mucilaginibacter sp.]
MEAAPNHLVKPTPLTPEQAFRAFFGAHTSESTREAFLYLFKAYVSQDNDKKHYPEEEIALFLDQLIDLVAAASQLHQANRVPLNPQEGTDHD